MIILPLRKSKLCQVWKASRLSISSTTTSKNNNVRMMTNRAIIPNTMPTLQQINYTNLQIRSMSSKIFGTIPKGGFGISVSHYAKVRKLSYYILYKF